MTKINIMLPATKPQTPKMQGVIQNKTTTFAGKPAVDAFEKRVTITHTDGVNFTGLFDSNPLKKAFKADPQLQSIYDKIVQGDNNLIPEMEDKLSALVSKGKLSTDDITPIALRLKDDVLESCYDKTTETKAATIVKLKHTKKVVVDRLNAYCKISNSYGKFFPGRSRKKGEKTLDQTRDTLNAIMSLKDKQLQKQGRQEIKEALVFALTPNVHIAAKIHAMEHLINLNMVEKKSDLNEFISEINGSSNNKYSRDVAIILLPAALHQYLASNKEKLSNDEVKNAVVESIKALQYISKQEKISENLKKNSRESIDNILVDKIIPEDLRKLILKKLYGL